MARPPSRGGRVGISDGEAKRMSGVTRTSLSVAQQRLILLMQAVNFGEIRDLHVKDGQPVFRPRPGVVRFLRLGAENLPRQELGTAEFALKKPVLELLDELLRIGDGCVPRIAIKHGIPTDLTVVGGFFDEID